MDLDAFARGLLELPGRVRIEIIKVPQGEAPVSIKEHWVGIQVDALRTLSTAGSRGVLSGREVVPSAGGYLVSWDSAVEALRAAGKEEAAQFWENLRHNPDGWLSFRADECKELAHA